MSYDGQQQTNCYRVSQGSRCEQMSGQDVNSLEVLTPEFFGLYDDLWQAASSIEASQVMFENASKQRNETQGKLKELQCKINKNRSFAVEQINRIDLVSNHWFYGTTALQPHLWLRGGCEGKIARAQVKLGKCDAEYPSLLQGKERIEKDLLPRLNSDVQRAREYVESASKAVTTREGKKATT